MDILWALVAKQMQRKKGIAIIYKNISFSFHLE